MTAFYNELEAYPAQWLRNLMAAGHIAPGVVDERSIVELRADDVAGHRRVHLFAGIGVWDYALRLAGWPDGAEVWTGSCPCQPYSTAGKGLGDADPRNLWPQMRRLVAECRPPILLGEQVASRAGRTWLAAVRADLEALGYAVGAADFGASSVGAPHIRQRLYWCAVADSAGNGRRQWSALRGGGDSGVGAGSARHRPLHGGATLGLADSDASGRGEQRCGGLLDGERAALGHDAGGRGALRGVGHADGEHAGRDSGAAPRAEGRPRLRPISDVAGAPGTACRMADTREGRRGRLAVERGDEHGGADEVRPAQQGGTETQETHWYSRVGALRAFGNGLCAPAAAAWVRAVMGILWLDLGATRQEEGA